MKQKELWKTKPSSIRRGLSLLVALAMLLMLLPQAAPVARADSYSGTCGDNLTWTFDPDTGTLTIEGSGAMKDFTDWSSYDENNSPWCDFKSSITALSLPTGLTTIGEDAFYECSGLISVTIPEGVTSIGGHAFYNCCSLSTVTIPASLKKMGDGAFGYYSEPGLTIDLTSVYISDLASWCGIEFGIDSNPLYYAHNLYLNGQLLTNLIIPQGVTSIGYSAFTCCTGLTSVTFPEELREIGGNAFSGCIGLNSLTLPEELTSIGSYAFSDCIGLTSLSLPEGLTSLGRYAFSGCTDLTSLTFQGGMTSVGDHAFYGCTGLSSVTFSEGPTGIGSYAFSGCTGLTSLTFCEGLTAIGSYAFSDCTGLNAVTLPKSLISIDIGAFNGCTGLTSVSIPKNVTKIGIMAFDGCTGLTDLTIAEGVTAIEIKAFYGCTGLSAVTLPESLSYVGENAFAECTGLTSVTMHSFGCTISLTNSKYTFGDPTKTTLYGYDNSSIWDYSLRWGYTFVSLGEYTPSNVCGQHLIWSFDDDTGVLTIEGSGSMTNYSLQSYDRAPWYSLSDSIASVSLPDGLTTIGSFAFYGCTALTEVTIPANVTTIGNGAFSGCTGLTEVTIPANVTTIGNGAFSGCTGLIEVTIPAAVDKIGAFVFTNCTALVRVLFQGDKAYIQTVQYYGTNGSGMEETPEDLTLTEAGQNMLGPHEQTVIYGCTTGADGDKHSRIVNDGWGDVIPAGTELISDMCPRYYAEKFGYTFYATDVFEDVRQGKYYTIPVAWAYGRGITNGKDDTHFGPNETCTRGQVVTFLWNAMGKPAPTITDCPFVDVKPGKYYYDAMLWALETGITSGKDDTHFAPNETCTRGQVVTFIWNAMGKPEPTITDCPFVDVKPGKYYYNAMLWALENGVTSGTDATHFSPNQTCTRGQVVTFLYNTLS